ncbi:branchpoint-bridging protein-like [Patiria miniata]|uniref:CCHC-type domain-containing protein n=1 Tax=Patiria miniata TaxID=46514 RepID=A0A914B6M2_PATMI|nr:branchpoint-bridging protein-like [Patiria miniata]
MYVSAGFLLTVKYSGQEETCRRCGEPGHKAAECPTIVCFNCQQPGHMSGECPQPRRCRTCGAEGHTSRECRQSYANQLRGHRLKGRPSRTDRPPRAEPTTTTKPAKQTTAGPATAEPAGPPTATLAKQTKPKKAPQTTTEQPRRIKMIPPPPQTTGETTTTTENTTTTEDTTDSEAFYQQNASGKVALPTGSEDPIARTKSWKTQVAEATRSSSEGSTISVIPSKRGHSSSPQEPNGDEGWWAIDRPRRNR